MILSLLRKLRASPHRRLIVLCCLLVVECVGAGYLWNRMEDPIVGGFLIKNGNAYIVAWRRRGHYLEARSMASLTEALHFAQRDLNLVAKTVNIPEHELESVWLEDRFGTYQVMWKRANIGSLNRLTFRRKADAMFFTNAFRRGDYSPSPLGHSVLLTPLSAN